MAGLVRGIPSMLGYLVRKGARQRNDASAAAEHNWSVAGPALPPGLELQWLGTSGFVLAFEGHRIAIDPYVTRIPLGHILRRRVVEPSEEAVDHHLPDRLDAILIGHTHFDHAIDAPIIARRDGCKVYGGRSMSRLMELYGLAPQSVDVEPYRVYQLGPFEVTFVPSVHSKLVLGMKIPYAGDITCEHTDELVPQRYCCGQVWGIHIAVAGVSFYHQGSADLIEDAIQHQGVDFFLAGIAGRSYTRNYVERICRALDPKVVVPHHFDDFFRPLKAPMQFSFNVSFDGFLGEVARVSRDIEIASLEPLQRVVGA